MSMTDKQAIELAKKLRQFCTERYKRHGCATCPFCISWALDSSECMADKPRSWELEKEKPHSSDRILEESKSYEIFDEISDLIDDWFTGEED